MSRKSILYVFLGLIVMTYGCKQVRQVVVVMNMKDVTMKPGTCLQINVSEDGKVYNDTLVWFGDGLIKDSTIVKNVNGAGFTKKGPAGASEKPNTLTNEEFENLIPEMISNQSPSGKAVSSSDYQDLYVAYKAFDSDIVDSRWISNNPNPGTYVTQWLSYTFPKPEKINVYSIRPEISAHLKRAPVDFEFQAWNAKRSEWITLDMQTGIVWDAAVKVFKFVNRKPYSTYRLYVTNSEGSDVVSIRSLKMGKAGE